jgi:hypothetical protein
MTGTIPIPRLPRRPLLDMRLGFALMRDGRVPLRHKALAVVLGLGVTGIVELLEIPVEGILAALLPLLGVLGDFVVDGAEIVAGPLILATLLLPFIAPHAVVEQIHSERSGVPADAPKGPIIDV